MKINIINPHGFCFGVNRAIKLAKDAAKKYPHHTYLLGQIVHNQFVVSDLEKKYHIKVASSLDQIPPASTVIFPAHGSSPFLYQQAQDRRLTIIDTTCPLVLHSHQIIKNLVKDFQKIIYLASDYHHDEAVAAADLAPQSITLTTLQDINNLKINHPHHTVLLTQSTLSVIETQKVFSSLILKFPSLTIHPHICLAASERQKAIIDYAKDSDLIIIVGAKNSSNSQRLFETALTTSRSVYLVESVADLSSICFTDIGSVALSSGASTPENIFKEVYKKINSIQL